jgi:hypothetical protein
MLQARLELALGYTPNWILSPFLTLFDELTKLKKSIFIILLAVLNKIPNM